MLLCYGDKIVVDKIDFGVSKINYDKNKNY